MMFHAYDIDKEPNAYQKAADIYTQAIKVYEDFEKPRSRDLDTIMG